MRTPSLCVCNAKVLSTSICNALNSLYRRILVSITEANTLNILITNENGLELQITLWYNFTKTATVYCGFGVSIQYNHKQNE